VLVAPPAATAEAAPAAPAAARETARSARRDDDPRWGKWRHQAAEKCWHRVEYAKTGDLAFLGHLDFQRQFQLVLRRSGLPLAYSKGYHPHPLLKFGPPLPVGVAGECEALDVALAAACPDAADRLRAAVPAGLEIRRVQVVGAHAPTAIDRFVSRCTYRAALPPVTEGGPTAEELASASDAFLASEEWSMVRQRPKGDIEIDVRPLVPDGGLTVENNASDGTSSGLALIIVLLRDARGANLPVHEFLASLLDGALAEPRWCRCVRTACHGQDDLGRWQTPLEDVMATGRRYWLRARFAD
jgi:radical SAM-linked protein